MADPIVSVTYSDAEIRQRLQRLQRKVGDLTPAMKLIGEELIRSTDDRFDQEIAPDGTPWKPNSAFTVAKKRAEGRILKVLQSTGQMRASITYQASRDRVVIGTNDQKARKHQFGVGVPKREFLGVSDEDRVEIVQIIEDFLAEA